MEQTNKKYKKIVSKHKEKKGKKQIKAPKDKRPKRVKSKNKHSKISKSKIMPRKPGPGKPRKPARKKSKVSKKIINKYQKINKNISMVMQKALRRNDISTEGLQALITLFPRLNSINPKTGEPLNLKDIMNKDPARFSEWMGMGYDILFGLIYLLKKHKNDCMPMKSYKSRDINQNISIFYTCENVQRKYKLSYPGNVTEKKFFDDINRCVKRGKRFVVVPVFIGSFLCNYSAGHANILIFDTKKHTAERFDTYGYRSGQFEDNWVYIQMDNTLESSIKRNLNYTYLRPIDFCPYRGFQEIEEANIFYGIESVRQGDPGGFCAAWTIFYADLRLTYPNISQKDIQLKAINIIKNKNTTFRRFIRNYSQFILNERKKLFAQLKIAEKISDNLISKKGTLMPNLPYYKENAKVSFIKIFMLKYLRKIIDKYT